MEIFPFWGPFKAISRTTPALELTFIEEFL